MDDTKTANLPGHGIEMWVRRANETATIIPWETAPTWANFYKVIPGFGLWMEREDGQGQNLVTALFYLTPDESREMPVSLRRFARPTPATEPIAWHPSGRASSNALRHKLESAGVGEVVRVDGEPWQRFEVPIGVDISEEPQSDKPTAEQAASANELMGQATVLQGPLYGGSPVGGQPNTVVDVDTVWGEALLRQDTEERMRKATDPKSFGGITLENILATRQCQQAAASYVDLVRKMQAMRDRLRESQAKQAAIEQEYTLLMERTTYARHALLRQILRQNGVDVSEGATHV